MKQRPVHEIKLGRIRAAIWANETDYGLRHHVTVGRLFKDRDDKWNTSDSFGRDDLLLVCKALDQAHTWIYAQPGAQEEKAFSGREAQRTDADAYALAG